MVNLRAAFCGRLASGRTCLAPRRAGLANIGWGKQLARGIGLSNCHMLVEWEYQRRSLRRVHVWDLPPSGRKAGFLDTVV